MFGKLEKERKEVASLTKIMTIYTVIRLCKRFSIPLEKRIIVSQADEDILGTSAMLVCGDNLSIEQLLYGLMLPSGNDAAHCLAFFFGSLIMKIGRKLPTDSDSSIDDLLKK